MKAADPPSSAADRWARLVAEVCDSTSDIRTIDEWARFVGVSPSSLCELCQVVRTRPHAAKNLARMLRAIVLRQGQTLRLEAVLDVSDHRTLRKLEELCGLSGAQLIAPTACDLLELQSLVPRDNEGLRALKQLVARKYGTA